MKKTQAFTLLELLVSFVLGSLLLATLFAVYFNLQKRSFESDQLRQDIAREQYLQVRLLSTLGAANGHHRAYANLPKSKRYFFTETDQANSLVFTYEHGNDPDPNMGGVVLGRLFLEESTAGGQLILERWSLPHLQSVFPWQGEAKAYHREVLFAPCRALHFHFLVKGEWLESIPKKKMNPLPDFVRLTVETEDHRKITYTVQLHNQHSHKLLYPHGGLDR